MGVAGRVMGSLATYSVAVAPGVEAERFNDAFYRFLELHCRSLREFEERTSMLLTTPLGDREEKEVSLWSQDALDQFVIFWRARCSAGRSVQRKAVADDAGIGVERGEPRSRPDD